MISVNTPVDPWNAWPTRVSLPPPILHIPTSETVSFYKPPEHSLKEPIAIKNSREAPNTSTSGIDVNKRKILPAWIRYVIE